MGEGGSRGSLAAAASTKSWLSLPAALGSGENLLVVEPEPAHEKDYERSCASGEAFVYAAMTRLR